MAKDYTHLPPDIPEIFTNLVGETGTALSTYLQGLGYDGNVYFIHDTWNKIAARLVAMSKTPSTSKFKYPLIALVHTFQQTVSSEGFFDVSLDFLIVNLTDPTWYGEDRRANNYVPILNPIYAQFMSDIANSNKFHGYKDRYYPHEKVDDYHMSENATRYAMPDIVDAIHIKGLKLKLTDSSIQC